MRQDKRVDAKIERTDYLEERGMMESKHFVSKDLKEVFSFYEPGLCFSRKICYGRTYWQVNADPVCGAVPKDFYKAEEMALLTEKVKDRSILLVRCQKRDYLVVNLNAAESMLRRFMTGLTYLRLKSVDGE